MATSELSIVRDPATIGALVRARRKAAGLTQAQAAGLAGVGNRFLSELERGKRTLELGLVLQVIERLGFELAIAPRAAHAFRAAGGNDASPPPTSARSNARTPRTRGRRGG